MPLTFFQARDSILGSVQPLDMEKIPLVEATGRALASDIRAGEPLPAFDNSAMDGFAVVAADCVTGATLPVAGYLTAGNEQLDRIEPGTAVRIMTGASIPSGTEAVIPFENCNDHGDSVTIQKPVKNGDNIRWAGEDIKSGDTVLSSGTLLRPSEISLLASLRQSTIPVTRKARVAILATGDELQDVDELRFKGGIVNSNSYALAAAIHEINATPLMLGIARDNRPALREKIEEGLQADALITSAGVSAGDKDMVRSILQELGAEEQFWKILLKPGHPTAFSLYGNKPVFSLPGNPVSTLLTYEELVRPALLKMMGHHNVLRTDHYAALTESISKKTGRTQLLRVIVEVDANGDLTARSAGNQNTGILKTSINAHGIAILDAETGYFDSGDKIPVHILGESMSSAG